MAKKQIYVLAPDLTMELVGDETTDLKRDGLHRRNTAWLLRKTTLGTKEEMGVSVGPSGRDDISPARRLVEQYSKKVFALDPWMKDYTAYKCGSGAKNMIKALATHTFEELERAIDNKAKEARITRAHSPLCGNFFSSKNNIYLAYADPKWEPPRSSNAAPAEPAPKDPHSDPLPVESVLQDASVWGLVVKPALKKRLAMTTKDYRECTEELHCHGIEVQNARRILHLSACSEYKKGVLSDKYRGMIRVELNRGLIGTELPYTVMIHARPTT